MVQAMDGSDQDDKAALGLNSESSKTTREFSRTVRPTTKVRGSDRGSAIEKTDCCERDKAAGARAG